MDEVISARRLVPQESALRQFLGATIVARLTLHMNG